MDLTLFNYFLPEELIAQAPAEKRDESRLLLVNRKTGIFEDRVFNEIPVYLSPGDLLVLNDTYVIPARLIGRKVPGGAAIEMLLLERYTESEWQVIAYRATRLKKGSQVFFSDSLSCEVLEILGEGKFRVQFSWTGNWEETLVKHGKIPLPPYIGRTDGEMSAMDKERYQTVFARPRKQLESAAAPTAGLHFTDNLLEACRKKGIHICTVTLRIGLDTFLPLRVDRVEDHRMHSESYFVSEETIEKIEQTRKQNGKIVAVGTTAVRVLESATCPDGKVQPGDGRTNLYIYPGYQFKTVDALITNFHLPRSTLLLLVSAFMGNELRQRTYNHAVEQRYRFYSYGDAMLIL